MNSGGGNPGVERAVETVLPTAAGRFRCLGYVERPAGTEHVALVLGDDPLEGPAPLVRVHSECLTGEAFGSRRCDCGPQLELAQQLIAREGRGVIVYLRGHEGRGIGLLNKLRAYSLQDDGLDTLDANLALGFEGDARDYRVAASILADLGVTSARLLTNNPHKVTGLAAGGIEIVERVGLQPEAVPDNLRYLRTKADRMGHRLTVIPGA